MFNGKVENKMCIWWLLLPRVNTQTKCFAHLQKTKDGEERMIKKRRKKQDGGILEEKKPKKNKVPRTG